MSILPGGPTGPPWTPWTPGFRPGAVVIILVVATLQATQCQRELRPYTPLVQRQLLEWLLAGAAISDDLPNARTLHMKIAPQSFVAPRSLLELSIERDRLFPP